MSVFLIAAVRAAFVLIATVSVSMMVITGISRAQPLVDPFAPYADILPGQSRETVVERGFTCQFNGPPFYGEFCTLNPEMGDFSEIRANIATSTGKISQLVFTPRKNGLAIGTLELLWGRPEVTRYGQTTNLRWHDLHIIAVPQGYQAHAPYLLPATYIAFESAD